MWFSALPVHEGSSFLLKYKKSTILVDGGKDEKHIVQLLKSKRIKNKHINLLICTHYDADHINGIIGVINSGYTFDEIWLPEIFGSLALTVSRNMHGLIKHYEERIKIMERPFFNNLDDGESNFEKNIVDEFSDLVNEQLIDEYVNENYLIRFFHYSALDMFHIEKRNTWQLKMLLDLYNICNLVKPLRRSGAHIKWLKYKKQSTFSKLKYGMSLLNGVCTAIGEYKPEKFFELLYLTKINKESLVFMFSKKGLPNILFTSDSDFSFTKNKITVKSNSVITAPHHGSKANNNVYSLITGTNVIYVRSDKSQEKRPSQTYMQQKRKYCTICRTKGPPKEIKIFMIINQSIVVKGKKCTCANITA